MVQSLLYNDDIWELALNSEYGEFAGVLFSPHPSLCSRIASVDGGIEPSIRGESLNAADSQSDIVVIPSKDFSVRQSLLSYLWS